MRPDPDRVRRLGYRPDPADRTRWRRPGSVLSIDGAKFFDHLQARGGGAIDLVLHANGGSFRQALDFLDPHPEPAEPALRIPLPHPPAWSRVRDRLAERALDPELLERCQAQGILHADARGNAVFRCRDAEGRATGAEIVGPRGFKRMAPGSRKRRGGFWFRTQAEPPENLLLVESAVDALSAAALARRPLLVVSLAGLATQLPEWTRPWRTPAVLCGFDRDPPGDAAARKLIQQSPRVRRVKPRNAKDWNELRQNTRKTNDA